MIAELHILAAQTRLSYKSVFIWHDPASYLANVVLRPAFTVALLVLASRFALDQDVAERYAVGGAAFAATWSMVGGIVLGFYLERAWATLPVLFSATGNRFQSYVTRGLLHLPNGALSLAVTLAVALLLIEPAFEGANWPAVLLCFAALSLSVMTFALLIGNFAIVFREWIVLRATGQALVMTCSGAFVPREDLPQPLAWLGDTLPVTHGLVGLRRALAGSGTGNVIADVGQELLVGGAYLLAGYLIFRRLERQATRHGRYDFS